MANNDKIKAAGITPVEATYGDTWTSQLPVLADYANVEAANPDFAEQYTAGQAKYATTPAALAGFQHIEELSKGGYFNKNFASAKFNDGLKDIASGKAAHYPQIGSVAAGLDEPVRRQDQRRRDVRLARPGRGQEHAHGVVAQRLLHPEDDRGREAGGGEEVRGLHPDPAGLRRRSRAALPTGPYLNSLHAAGRRVAVAKDTQRLLRGGRREPGAGVQVPDQGPVAGADLHPGGHRPGGGDKGAALYDADVKKQAQQLGLPGWD